MLTTHESCSWYEGMSKRSWAKSPLAKVSDGRPYWAAFSGLWPRPLAGVCSAALDARPFGAAGRARALGQTTLEARLARWCLTLACHQAVAKQHVGDEFRADACALDGGLDGCATQVVGRQRGEIALKAAHGGAGCADDNDGIGYCAI